MRAGINRSLRALLAGSLVFGGALTASLVVGVLPASAATLTVTTCSDSGAGSLRQAVIGASAGDTIDFAPSPSCSLITLTSGDIAIARNLTIHGPGAGTLAVSSNDQSVAFVIDGGVTATISGLTIDKSGGNSGGAIQNAGTLNVTNSILSNNIASIGQGGGILSGGTLNVTDSTLTGNSAGAGGGILNNGGTLSVTGSTLSGNSAITAGHGGAIYNWGGTATVTNSTLSGNSASSSSSSEGGGIINYGGTLSVTGSTLSGNSASGGGAIGNDNGTATVTGSTLSGNTSTYLGGGIENQDTLTVTDSTLSGNSVTGQSIVDGGGGIANSDSAVVTDSTLSGNSVTGASVGGGIYNNDNSFAGTLTVNHATLTDNTAGSGNGGGIYVNDPGASAVPLVATIVANSGAGLDCVNASGAVSDSGYNLDDDGSCGFSGGNNSLSHTPAGLDPSGLASNGGPTKTVALETGSAAIDHVTVGSDCTGNDQTGTPWSTPCNIGAIGGGSGPAGFTISTSSLPSASPGVAYGPLTLQETGAGTSTSPYATTFKWKKIALPKGLKLSKDGVLSGTPNAKLAAGPSSVTVQVTETVTTLNGKKKVKTKTTVQATIPLTIT